MGHKYAVSGSMALIAADTILYFVNGATSPRRLALIDLVIGSSGTPADQAARLQLKRITNEDASPGGSALTPVPVDAGDPAALSNGVSAPTTEGTYESVLPILDFGLNQRASFRWVAAPGSEPKCAAAEDNGFGLFCLTVSTQWTSNQAMIYEE